ncbi:MAG: hypothetical protein JWM04_701 [Verrucomicrobiales bacterium]|jgi:hypothetical protein|nr:hypothetical protein [Verrucomicrobiales bacterium]
MLNRQDTQFAGFVFKGHLAAEEVRTLTGTDKRSAEIGFDEIAAKVSLILLDDDLVNAARKMSAVYIAIASFENSVRDLVSSRLLELKGANWWNTCVTNADIRNRATSRQDQEKQIRWHQARGLSPIYYIEMGDLVSIIQTNWDSFEDLLHDIGWVRQIFKSLERSRNVIMHSGQLSMDDVERVGVFIRDWLRQVGG